MLLQLLEIELFGGTSWEAKILAPHVNDHDTCGVPAHLLRGDASQTHPTNTSPKQAYLVGLLPSDQQRSWEVAIMVPAGTQP